MDSPPPKLGKNALFDLTHLQWSGYQFIHSSSFYINFDYFYALYNIYAEFKFYINFDYFYAVFVQYLC